jgi:NAD(P) transhydrogenase subunit alpha
MEAIDPFVFRLSIFVLAIFVGYFVVWAVTPALHTPLMSVTNAISSVIVVGALIAVSVTTHPNPPTTSIVFAPNGDVSVNGGTFQPATPSAMQSGEAVITAAQDAASAAYHSEVNAAWTSKLLGFFALILACVNIFGGFLVTARMLAMYKKKEGK